jgi:hypothetical protein
VDTHNAMMAIQNLIALKLLGPALIILTRQYLARQEKAAPHAGARGIGPAASLHAAQRFMLIMVSLFELIIQIRRVRVA